METGANAWPRTAAAVIDGRTAPRLAGAIAGAWDGEAEPGGEPEPATHANARDSRTARAVAAVAGVLAMAAALAIATRATESGERAAHPGRARGWFRGTPALAAPTSGPADGRNPGRGEQDMRSLVTAGAALAIGAAAQAQVGEPVQWRVEDGGNGHWYQISPTAMTWPAAAESAQRQGGNLVTITTAAEQDFIASLPWEITDSWGVWMGARRDGCTWSWMTGESWGFTRWAPNEPNGGCIPAYLLIYVQLGTPNELRWDDCICPPDGVPTGSVVEFSADCNSNGIVDFGEIRAGQLPDQNANNVPDGCECAENPRLAACQCDGDLVRDGTVDGADLGVLLAFWGPTTSERLSQESDTNADGHVDGADLGVLLLNWGPCRRTGPKVPAWATLLEPLPDPTVIADAALRTAIMATGLAWRVEDTGTGIEMLIVPPGTFVMGCSPETGQPCNPMELPAHDVTLTKPFYLGRYEVTQSEWVSSGRTNPSHFQDGPDSASRPVDSVSWTMANDFAQTAKLRLPTEAEWEFACRAGTTTAFLDGSDTSDGLSLFAWWGSNSGGQSHPVGTRAANRLGIHDMPGSVWEWCADWYGEYARQDALDPKGPLAGPGKILRGSSWFGESSTEFRSSYRGWEPATFADYWRGFRVARDP